MEELVNTGDISYNHLSSGTHQSFRFCLRNSSQSSELSGFSPVSTTFHMEITKLSTVRIILKLWRYSSGKTDLSDIRAAMFLNICQTNYLTFRVTDSLNILRGFFLFLIFTCKKNILGKTNQRVRPLPCDISLFEDSVSIFKKISES